MFLSIVKRIKAITKLHGLVIFLKNAIENLSIHFDVIHDKNSIFLILNVHHSSKWNRTILR